MMKLDTVISCIKKIQKINELRDRIATICVLAMSLNCLKYANSLFYFSASIQMPLNEINPCFVLIFSVISFTKLEHGVALYCISMSSMAKPPISIDSVMAFLFTLTFLCFSIVAKEIVCVFFYVLDNVCEWLFRVARCPILLGMNWFINIFFRMSDSCKSPHFRISSRIFFFLYPTFVLVLGWYCVSR